MFRRAVRVPSAFTAHRLPLVSSQPIATSHAHLRMNRSLTSQAMAPLSSATVAQLQKYTACDISDALLKLKVPGAGFIADLNSYSLPAGGEAASIAIAPVSTVLFAAKGETPSEPVPNVPKDAHWADVTEPGTFVLMKQPPGQTNAICGGIMALRMKLRQVKGIVVAGRVRDLPELRSTNLPIWAYGISTVGSGGGSVPWAMQVPIEINGTIVNPGDVAFHDATNGVVIIPQDKVDQVLELLPRLTAADEKVKEDVLRGMSVHEAFKLHRGA
ncbi:4-hydroxy-4-methyl-2-oxoglutarate aldolase [Tolypocladium ophioglossoides CBS 100239]|uniref:4-hydroxy-4-methyl-2-oxoglutarate aldolase n=1 Tax=Tolypocladium ophioglossoides (strain CBS 100239) TaxID=1163406 RepID=A0A0L0N2D4_TOLOC|nr:4-hydroxy-4-methyl-2-oxoglutarate aldolase [Tolypocladium ophioglossoides CBS 100239]